MARCEACDKLDNAKSSTPPHEDLLLLGREDYHAGHKSYFERYRCKVCLTAWIRDMDKRDSGAIWEPSKQ